MAEDIFDEGFFQITRFVGPGKTIKYQFNFQGDYAVYTREELLYYLDNMKKSLERET